MHASAIHEIGDFALFAYRASARGEMSLSEMTGGLDMPKRPRLTSETLSCLGVRLHGEE